MGHNENQPNRKQNAMQIKSKTKRNSGQRKFWKTHSAEMKTHYKIDCKSHAFDHFQNLSKKGHRKTVENINHLEIRTYRNTIYHEI